MGFKLNGIPQMQARLRRIAVEYPEKVGAAMYKEAQIEMTESKRRVPVDTGALRASGIVSEPEVEGERVSVVMSYGGVAADYAIYVHENLDAFHPVGQAKYLESVLNESRPYMALRIAKRIGFEVRRAE